MKTARGGRAIDMQANGTTVAHKIVAGYKLGVSLKPLHDRHADADRLGSSDRTHPVCAEPPNLADLVSAHLGSPDWPAALGAVALGATHVGQDPLTDHRPLELGEHPEHLEQRAAGGFGRIDGSGG